MIASSWRSEPNLLIYQGVLAPHAGWRRRVVAYSRMASKGPDARGAGAVPVCEGARPTCQPRGRTWGALMRRAFEISVLACPRCGGRLRLIATIEDPRVIRRILAHLGLPISLPPPDRLLAVALTSSPTHQPRPCWHELALGRALSTQRGHPRVAWPARPLALESPNTRQFSP